MTTDSREKTVFWYIVLQPVVLKDERNCAVLELDPHMMILVEKLWVVGPNMVLAQVVYPAEGYVPRERITFGKLIARLDPGGPKVPQELLEIGQNESNRKLAVFGNQTKCCLFNHKEYRFSRDDHRALNQRLPHYSVTAMVPRSHSDPSLGNTCVGGPLRCPQNQNQKNQFENYLGCYGPVELSNSLSVCSLPEFLSGVPSNVSNQYMTNGCRCIGNLGHPPCSSAPTEKKLSNLTPALNGVTSDHNFRKSKDLKNWYNVYQTKGLHNFSNPSNHVPIDSNSKTGVVNINEDNSDRLKFPCRKNFKQCLLSIYHSVGRRAETGHGNDMERTKQTHNIVITEQIPVTKAKDEKKSQMVAVLQHQKQWRYEPKRWITVSALCHELEVLCLRNKRQVRSTNSEPYMIFHSQSIPDISLRAYLKRIAWFLGCSTACFVLALEYIYRLARHCPEVKLNDYSVHQIVITCIMVATKFIDDKKFKNTFYARVAGVSVTNLSALEVRLIFFLNFDVRVLPEQYKARYEAMLRDNQGPNMVIIRPDGNAF